jgi:single-strand DNA-binding protein
MYDLNKVMLIGRITTELELKKNQTGKSFCNFSLACTMSKNKENGNSVTEFINCTIWDKSAEFFNSWADKGDLIYIEGKLNTTSQDNNGKKTYYTKVVVSDFKVLNSNQKSQNNNNFGIELEDINTPF